MLAFFIRSFLIQIPVSSSEFLYRAHYFIFQAAFVFLQPVGNGGVDGT